MIITRPLSNLALAMMALPVILGAWLCYVRPEKAVAWAIGMAALPVLWFVVRAAAKAFGRGEACATTMQPEKAGDARKIISGAMIFAGLLISTSLGMQLAAGIGLMGDPSADALTARMTGVVMGGFLMFYGNRLPKMLWPLSSRCDAATMQTFQRRAGWAYVLAGLGHVVVYLVLPMDLAPAAGMAVIVAGVLIPSAILVFRAKWRATRS